MQLKEIKIGEKFKLTPKGIVWIKLNVQGMYDLQSSIQTELTYKTRCQRMSKRNKVIPIDTEVYVL